MKLKFWLPAFLFVIPNLAVSQSPLDTLQLLYDVKALSADSMQGRKSCTIGSRKAQQYILTAFQKNQLQPFNGSFKQYFSFSTRGSPCDSAANLIGFLAGTAPNCIVLSAHYDHLGVVNGKIYHGADDNASGVAALLALMNYFSRHQPQHTLIFAVFDGEEAGLLGAKAFVENLPVAQSRVALNINLDMVSRNEKNELYAAGCSHYPFLQPPLKKIAKTSAVKLLLGHDKGGNSSDNWTNASDHAAFHAKGIPFLYFGVEDHADYHQPADIFEKISSGFFINATASILAAVLALDQSLEALRQAGMNKSTPSGH